MMLKINYYFYFNSQRPNFGQVFPSWLWFWTKVFLADYGVRATDFSENLPPGQGTGKLWKSMLSGSDNEYWKAFKRWEQKAFLEALPRQCVERWFTTLLIWMAESSWYWSVLEDSVSARKHYSGIIRGGDPNPTPHLHQPTCTDSARTFYHQQKNISASSCQIHLQEFCSHHHDFSMLQDRGVIMSPAQLLP